MKKSRIVYATPGHNGRSRALAEVLDAVVETAGLDRVDHQYLGLSVCQAKGCRKVRITVTVETVK